MLEPHTPRLSTLAVTGACRGPSLIPGERLRELESGFAGTPARTLGAKCTGKATSYVRKAMKRNQANRVAATGCRGQHRGRFAPEGWRARDESVLRMIVRGVTSLRGPKSYSWKSSRGESCVKV